jgi:hypothetical protein
LAQNRTKEGENPATLEDAVVLQRRDLKVKCRRESNRVQQIQQMKEETVISTCDKIQTPLLQSEQVQNPLAMVIWQGYRSQKNMRLRGFGLLKES